jgi:hypothetical protein
MASMMATAAVMHSTQTTATITARRDIALVYVNCSVAAAAKHLRTAPETITAIIETRITEITHICISSFLGI